MLAVRPLTKRCWSVNGTFVQGHRRCWHRSDSLAESSVGGDASTTNNKNIPVQSTSNTTTTTSFTTYVTNVATPASSRLGPPVPSIPSVDTVQKELHASGSVDSHPSQIEDLAATLAQLLRIEENVNYTASGSKSVGDEETKKKLVKHKAKHFLDGDKFSMAASSEVVTQKSPADSKSKSPFSWLQNVKEKTPPPRGEESLAGNSSHPMFNSTFQSYVQVWPLTHFFLFFFVKAH